MTTVEISSASAQQARGRRFAGRTVELQALEASFRVAASGRGQLVTVAGKPGVGKTRMLEEFLARIGLPEHRVLWGRCPETEGVPAYWPWSQALRAWIERSDDVTLGAALGPAVPQLARLVPAPGCAGVLPRCDRGARARRAG